MTYEEVCWKFGHPSVEACDACTGRAPSQVCEDRKPIPASTPTQWKRLT